MSKKPVRIEILDVLTLGALTAVMLDLVAAVEICGSDFHSRELGRLAGV